MKLSKIEKLPHLGSETKNIDGIGLIAEHIYLDSTNGLLYFVIHPSNGPARYRTVRRDAMICVAKSILEPESN